MRYAAGPVHDPRPRDAGLYALDSNTVQTQLIESTILRAIYSKRQLFERMVEFWTDHFNTDITTVGILKTQDVRDVLRCNALGSFLGMLNAQATSPAMINRLNNQQNSRTSPNQNYAREVMELHTLGVTGGYSQQDIVEVARCFTGWRYVTTTSDPNRGTFLFNQSVHDTGTKQVLGNTITSAGVNEGMLVLRILAEHPATARFVAKKLLRWFIDYEPSDAMIADVAEVVPPEQRRHQDGGEAGAGYRERPLGAAALQASVPLHRLGPPRDERQHDALRLAALHVAVGHGADSVQLEPAERLSAFVRVPGARWCCRGGTSRSRSGFRATSAARRSIRPPCWRAPTRRRTIANRIDLLLFGGEMPVADKAALVTYLRPDPPSTTRIRDAFGLALASPGFQWY